VRSRGHVVLGGDDRDPVRTSRWLMCGVREGDRPILGRPWGPLGRSAR
jgi:hypothetical protein